MNKLKQQIQTEVDTAYLYRSLALRTQESDLAEIFRKMADIEDLHAQKFMSRMQEHSPSFKKPTPSRRAQLLVFLSQYMGNNIILSNVVSTEALITDRIQKEKLKKGEQLSGHENLHFNIIQSILKRKPQTGNGKILSQFEGKHRTIGGNELRASVLGANDGLVSNLSLVMGVAGATHGQEPIIIAGIAGLVAGAISMALGEWLSVQSARELYQRQIDIEAEELEASPEEEKSELILLYQAKGMQEDEAKRLTTEVFEHKDQALETLIKEELAIDIDTLGGSAWKAATASFLLFSFGALIPLLPFLIPIGSQAPMISLVFSSLALFCFGAFITVFTGKSILYAGSRQVIFGLLAALITFSIGKIIGISIS
ncbi:MAG: VIT1/CCC1 transporter family protein [Gammaproteobacteria bacterium]